MRQHEPIGRTEDSRSAEREPSRSLVALSHTSTRGPAIPCSFHPDASFVAQLIAAATNVPQSRMLRRASTADALLSYRGAADRQRGHAAPIGKGTSLVA